MAYEALKIHFAETSIRSKSKTTDYFDTSHLCLILLHNDKTPIAISKTSVVNHRCQLP